MWDSVRRKLYDIDVSVKEHSKKWFPYQRPLRRNQLLDNIKSGALFGYVQCDIEVPEHLREKFANIPPIFKNTKMCRQDICPIMQEYAEKKRLMSQPRWLLISSFELIKGIIFTPLLLFYFELWLVCTKIYRFVEYTPMKTSKIFLQSTDPLSMLFVGETKIPTLVFLQQQWSCLQTIPMAVKKWIAVAIQLQSIRITKKHMHQSTLKFWRDWAISTINFTNYSLPNLKMNINNQSL